MWAVIFLMCCLLPYFAVYIVPFFCPNFCGKNKDEHHTWAALKRGCPLYKAKFGYFILIATPGSEEDYFLCHFTDQKTEASRD